MKKSIFLAVAATTAVSLAACGNSSGNGSAPAGGTAADKDPCSLLTDAQVEKVLEIKPKSHKEQTGVNGVRGCKWETDEVVGSLTIYYGSTSNYPIADIDSSRGDKWEKISGLGDKAGFLHGTLVATGNGINIQVGCVPKLVEKNGTTNDNARSRDKNVEAAGYALKALGVNVTVKEAPAATTSETTKPKATDEPKSTKTSEKPTETSEPAEPSDTDTSDAETPTVESPAN